MIWKMDGLGGTANDNHIAQKDGWMIAKGSDGWKIFASLATPTFQNDHQALHHVETQAALGSEFHQRALAFITMKRLTK